MKYQVFYRCMMCQGLFVFETIGIPVESTLELKPSAQEVEKAARDYWKQTAHNPLIIHNCLINTGLLLPEGDPPSQIGLAAFVGMRRVI